jgi:signal transduction histidine kinase
VAFAERSSQLHAARHLWNGAANLAVFLAIAAMVSTIAASRRRQDELLQFIVHDLRSPMTNIQSGLQTLQEMSEGKLDDTDQELIAMALVSSDRVLTLVNSLLDPPRIESGKLPLHLEAIPTEELVTTALDQVGMWARQNQVDLKADGDGAPPAVMADRVVTGRVLVNLLSNALKYSPPMSTITLRARPSDDGHVVLSVEDQGPGIPPEWVDKVFDPFTQVASRKSGAATGTGLGLTFCQKAVQAQGGRIWLKSKLGHGTTVSVALPKAA